MTTLRNIKGTRKKGVASGDPSFGGFLSQRRHHGGLSMRGDAHYQAAPRMRRLAFALSVSSVSNRVQRFVHSHAGQPNFPGTPAMSSIAWHCGHCSSKRFLCPLSDGDRCRLHTVLSFCIWVGGIEPSGMDDDTLNGAVRRTALLRRVPVVASPPRRTLGQTDPHAPITAPRLRAPEHGRA